MSTPARLSAREVVYTHVREGIIEGRFPPGSLLSENELAAARSVSRQPVREALLLLAREDLVEVRPQSGTYVTRIDPARVREAQFIREAIELASLQTCPPLRESDERMLRSLIRRQRTARGRDDLYPLDEDFHRALLGLAGHSTAWVTVSVAKGHLDRARYLGMSATREVQDYVSDHERVVDALAIGDINTAATILREHLRFVLDDLEAVQRLHPELFNPSIPARIGRSARR